MKTSIINFDNTFSLPYYRLDSEFYLPEYLELENKLENLNTTLLSNLSKSIDSGPFGSNLLRTTYINSGIPVVRPFNIKEFTIEKNNLVFINQNDVKEKKLKTYTSEDILFSRVGDIRCGIVPPSFEKITISPNIIAVKLNKSKINPYYLSIFINSKYGFPQITRGLKIVAQPTIQTDLVKGLKIALCTESFQVFIEKLVKKSFELSDLSYSNLRMASLILLNKLNLPDRFSSSTNIFTRDFSEIKRYKRVDADYYLPFFDEVEFKIKTYTNGYYPLKDVFLQNKEKKIINEEKKYKYIEIGCVDIEDGYVVPLFLNGEDLPDNAKIRLLKGDILISKVRPNRGAIAIVGGEDFVGSSAFTVLREQEIVNKETLFSFLRLRPILEYTLKYNSGTSYPTITDQDILNLSIPNFEAEIQSKVKSLVKNAFDSRTKGIVLREIAISGVEEAISNGEISGLKYLKSQLEILGIVI